MKFTVLIRSFYHDFIVNQIFTFEPRSKEDFEGKMTNFIAQEPLPQTQDLQIYPG